MSSQSTPSILFTHRFPQKGFRLLELPPELADLLSSDNAPTLELKSPSRTSTTGSATATDPSTEYVNLCTPSQTYSIRQVQSSNSLHILQPSNGGGVRKRDMSIVGGATAQHEEQSEDTDMANDSDLNIVGTVSSITKCGSTLELHMPSDGFSAVPFLRTLLRTYEKHSGDMCTDGEGDKDITDIELTETRRNIVDRLFADIPVSRAQCERGWIEICAFVLPTRATANSDDSDSGSASSCCWRPSAGMKLEAWKSVLEGAVLQGIDLGRQFLVEDLWKSVLDDDSLGAPFPRPLFEAVIRRFCESAGGEIAEFGVKWASIDKESCVRWVGIIYLEAVTSSAQTAIGQSEFLDAWKDQLPETWGADVSLSILPKENCYMDPEAKTICFGTEAERQKAQKNLPRDSSAATAAKKSRNWHELFRNQKRQKR